MVSQQNYTVQEGLEDSVTVCVELSGATLDRTVTLTVFTANGTAQGRANTIKDSYIMGVAHAVNL